MSIPVQNHHNRRTQMKRLGDGGREFRKEYMWYSAVCTDCVYRNRVYRYKAHTQYHQTRNLNTLSARLGGKAAEKCRRQRCAHHVMCISKLNRECETQPVSGERRNSDIVTTPQSRLCCNTNMGHVLMHYTNCISKQIFKQQTLLKY